MKVTEPRAMQEVHEMREKLHEEIKNMTAREKAEYLNKTGHEIAERYGLKFKQKMMS